MKTFIQSLGNRLSDGIGVYDESGRRVYHNQAYHDFRNRTDDDHPNLTEVYPEVSEWNRLQAGDTIRIEDPSNNLSIRITPFSYENSRYFLAVRSVEDPSGTDDLTGLVESEGFERVVNHALQRYDRHGTPVSVVYIDLDRMKEINDTHGHETGDQMLCTIVDRLQEVCRDNDTLARLGGDEFAGLLFADMEDARAVTERFVQRVEEPMVTETNTRITMTASFGIATADPDVTAAELIDRADTAMYKAKESDTDTIRTFDRSMKQAQQKHDSLADQVDRAFENDEWILYRAPILSQGDFSGWDQWAFRVQPAWDHPEEGVLSVGTVRDVLIDRGLNARLDEWMIRRLSDHPDTTWLLPISRSSVAHADISECVETHWGDRADRLNFSLNESKKLADNRDVLTTLNQLDERGVGLYLSGFGKGYSSLHRLGEFPVDGFLVDESFLENIQSDRNHHKILRAILQMGNQLGMRVITPGVETNDQARFLRELGVDGLCGPFVPGPERLEEPSHVE